MYNNNDWEHENHEEKILETKNSWLSIAFSCGVEHQMMEIKCEWITEFLFAFFCRMVREWKDLVFVLLSSERYFCEGGKKMEHWWLECEREIGFSTFATFSFEHSVGFGETFLWFYDKNFLDETLINFLKFH
jgi:hypothetical protein